MHRVHGWYVILMLYLPLLTSEIMHRRVTGELWSNPRGVTRQNYRLSKYITGILVASLFTVLLGR